MADGLDWASDVLKMQDPVSFVLIFVVDFGNLVC
jgi:hypothetical protein